MARWRVVKPGPPRLDHPVGAGLAAATVLAAGLMPVNADPADYLPDAVGISALPSIVVASAMAAVTFVVLLALPRQWPLIGWAVLAQPAASTASAACVALATYVVAANFRRPHHLAAYVGAAHIAMLLPVGIGLAVGVRGIDLSDLPGALGGAVLFVWLPLLVGLWTRARRQVVAGLRDKAARLEAEQAVVVEQARSRERARIARDMHDVVAHQVSLMVLHAGALEVNAKDEVTVQTAELIRTTGVESLGRLRDVLKVLRTADAAPQPVLVDLADLVAGSRKAGLAVVVRESGALDQLPTLVAHTVYHVVRESLTNVHKHAGPVPTDVEIIGSDEQVTIRVRNAAPVRVPQPLPGSGCGLIGLRERVSLLEGSFMAGPNEADGFEVVATIPLERRSVEATA